MIAFSSLCSASITSAITSGILGAFNGILHNPSSANKLCTSAMAALTRASVSGMPANCSAALSCAATSSIADFKSPRLARPASSASLFKSAVMQSNGPLSMLLMPPNRIAQIMSLIGLFKMPLVATLTPGITGISAIVSYL